MYTLQSNVFVFWTQVRDGFQAEGRAGSNHTLVAQVVTSSYSRRVCVCVLIHVSTIVSSLNPRWESRSIKQFEKGCKK